MKKIYILICIAFVQCNAYAYSNYLECNGYDSIGKTTKANIYCSQGCKQITTYINGDRFYPVGETRGANGFVTKKFVTTAGIYVYDSVIFNEKDFSLNLYQFNAATDALIATAKLACHIANDHSAASSIRNSNQINLARRR